MMQWIRSAPVALFGVRPAPAVVPFSPATVAREPSPRAAHAQMLAAAAARRQRAQTSGEDAAYWLAVAPQALARARQLRAQAAFAPLP